MQDIAKLFALIMGIVVIARSLSDFRTKKENLQMTLFWVSTWTAVIVIAIFPQLSQNIIHIFGDNRTGLGTIFGMAIVFLFFISYRIYIKAQRVEKYAIIIARNIALQEFTKRKRWL